MMILLLVITERGLFDFPEGYFPMQNLNNGVTLVEIIETDDEDSKLGDRAVLHREREENSAR